MSSSPLQLTITDPPKRFKSPRYTRLAAGSTLHRIHSQAYGSDSFNSSHSGDARFSPIFRPDGTVIPTLYAANSFDGAAFETILHDVPVTLPKPAISYKRVINRVYSTLSIQREFNLITLTEVDLKKWGTDRTHLIQSPAECYRRTQQWAAALHRQFKEADGIHWMSRQLESEHSYVLFGDRVSANDLVEVTAPSNLWSNAPLIRALSLCAERVGTRITSPTKPSLPT
jgi:RES domain